MLTVEELLEEKDSLTDILKSINRELRTVEKNLQEIKEKIPSKYLDMSVDALKKERDKMLKKAEKSLNEIKSSKLYQNYAEDGEY